MNLMFPQVNDTDEPPLAVTGVGKDMALSTSLEGPCLVEVMKTQIDEELAGYPLSAEYPFGGKLTTPVIPSLYRLAIVFRPHIAAPARKDSSAKRKRQSDADYGDAIPLLKEAHGTMKVMAEAMQKKKKTTASEDAFVTTFGKITDYLEELENATAGAE